MKKKILLILAGMGIVFSLLALSLLEGGNAVFSDNFSSGNFASWSRTFSSPGSSQSVSNGAAHFIVPTPNGGNVTYSYLVKDGFTSTVNSTIVASQDVWVTKVPYGCSPGLGAIFFLYICDSRDLGGNYGNLGVGIDGCGLWSLWIGGNTVYKYVYQTVGAAPASNTWYHIALAINNSAGTAELIVDGTAVISESQSQFTDGTHAVSLMSGMGEDWWSQGTGLQEIEVSNVLLDISDAAPILTHGPAPTATAPTDSSSSPVQTPSSTPNYNPAPTSTHKATATPSATPPPSPLPSIANNTEPTSMLETKQDSSLWIILPLAITVAVCAEILFMTKKR
jgi:cell division septation protein DedD